MDCSLVQDDKKREECKVLKASTYEKSNGVKKSNFLRGTVIETRVT